MGKIRSFFWIAGITVAATLGAGQFALPRVLHQAGWLPSALLLVLVSVLVSFAHSLYWDVLQKVHEKSHLLRLAATHLGKWGKVVGIFAIGGGLFLTLGAYLVLAGNFLEILFPSLGTWGVLIFWLISSLPIMFRVRNFAISEILGVAVTLGVILVVFAGALGSGTFPQTKMIDTKFALLPFGVLLFAFAGWTGVEPAVRLAKELTVSSRFARAAMRTGTFFVAALYALFVVSVWVGSGRVSSDAISGFSALGPLGIALLAVFGLFAMRTSYGPIGLELKTSLEKDAGIPGTLGTLLVFFIPPLFPLLGFDDFLALIGLAGGVFLSLQYLLIVRVGRKVLTLGPAKKLFADAVAFSFILAAVYEVYVFVLH